MFLSDQRWSECIQGRPVPRLTADAVCLIGVLEGEGCGPEVISACLRVMDALEAVGLCKFQTRRGGPIGLAAEQQHGTAFTAEVMEFCRDVFANGGALLHGAGGGRFVYDLRRHFDLFCKICPVRVCEELGNAGRLKPEHLAGVDIVIVRENCAGVYQGRWSEGVASKGGRTAEHSFSYSEQEVRRIVEVAVRISQRRRGELTVVVKEGGVPAITKLWRDCALDIAAAAGIKARMMNVDYAAYGLLQHARQFDVVVAPNLFGDVLVDISGVLLGSRALGYSGNFSSGTAAVYQTNHGAAYDLGGQGKANPAGQIFSLAMLLRESFGLLDAAEVIERAVRAIWRQGWRTAELEEPGCRLAGTREMGELVADAVMAIAHETGIGVTGNSHADADDLHETSPHERAG